MTRFDYARMRHTADRLLDRFQQGEVVLARTMPGEPDPERPWVEVPPVEQTEVLRAVVSGAQEYADGQTVLETDLRIVAAVPALDWRPGNDAVLSLTIDERPLTIVRARGIPEAGTATAVEFIARG